MQQVVVRQEATKLRKMSSPALALLTRTHSCRATHRLWTSHAQPDGPRHAVPLRHAEKCADQSLYLEQSDSCNTGKVPRLVPLIFQVPPRHPPQAIRIPVSSLLKIEYEVSCSSSCPDDWPCSTHHELLPVSCQSRIRPRHRCCVTILAFSSRSSYRERRV